MPVIYHIRGAPAYLSLADRDYQKSDGIGLLAAETIDTSSSFSLPAFFLCLAASGTISLTACAFGAGLQNNGGIGRGVLIEER
jgi:hypothetical protein